ncbi:MAG: ABC transporter ATP-binding protein [Ignavibacteria bacterium]|nr:ABC transporter ATP-binding protein [Ignavibacteria bacterium]
MKNNVLIKLRGIHKSYTLTRTNTLNVLKGINLDIYSGEIAAIVGKSGAGKSTLLHIIGALDKPDHGEMHFNGTDMFSLSDKNISSARAKDIGFIFQYHHLLPEFTAFENVQIAAMIAGNKETDKIKNILNVVGLSERMHHKPSELSGGEAQRVAIARALINSPKIILADEPTGNLDTENANSVIDLIFELRKKLQQTFLIVTHNEDFAAKCDRIIKIADGKIV